MGGLHEESQTLNNNISVVGREHCLKLPVCHHVTLLLKVGIIKPASLKSK